MVHADRAIFDLIVAYAGARKLSRSYASRLLTGSGDTLRRMQRGTSLTSKRAARIVRTATDHWPEGAEWPADLPRPAPSASPSHTPAPAPGGVPDPDDPIETVRAAKTRISAAIEASDWPGAERAEREMLEIATRLGPHGRIASPRALCLALGARRYVLDQVVRAYADGRPRAHALPRRSRHGQSPTERMFTALVASGDVRFRSRRHRAAA